MPRREKNDKALIWDMMDAARAIEEFVSGKTFDEYMKNRMLRSAVERNLEIIGEAANKTTDATRLKFPDIPWRKMISQRHVLAHEYGELKHEVIWQVVSHQLKDMAKRLETILSQLDSQEASEQ